MEGKRLIEKIKLRNILSFGDKGEEITLEPLNIIIGQNASGKSNLVDVIKLLRSLPQDRGLVNFISRNGGISEWIWKGRKSSQKCIVQIVTKDEDEFFIDDLVSYEIQLENISERTNIDEELIEDYKNKKTFSRKYLYSDEIYKRISKISFDDSILSIRGHIKDDNMGLKSHLKYIFSSFIVFTDLQTNRKAEMRKIQLPDAPNTFLEEDGNNLALVLNDLEHRGDTKDKIVENLKKFNPRIKDYSIRILGGTVQLFIREEGLEKPVSAMRLSDGTLRYLCLLAILCHPEPPPLICIEEPETGLHPDILPTIAELMIEASARTQLIVTTHSDIFVSAFSEIPEAVLVCEKDEDGTHFRRLEKEKLKAWLAEYELGDLWLRGEIGGKRW